jgi:hypothetical protein
MATGAERRKTQRRGSGRRSRDQAVEIHGVKAVIPGSWEDHSVHRFAAPPGGPALPMQARVKAKPASAFRTNLVVSKLAVPPDLALPVSFELPNQNSAARNPTFRVNACGCSTWLEQDVVWQDTSFMEPGLGMQMFQRSIAIMAAPGTLVMFTLTADANTLADISRDQLKFDPARAKK